MEINILHSANTVYSCILSVKRGSGDAKLMCWIAKFADEFKVRVGEGYWFIQVRCTKAAYKDFLNEFKPYLVPNTVPV
jgi:hypothetical protein